MNPENKQRIVGIIVLIAFVALLIPFLFTSGIKKKSASVDELAAPVQITDTNIPVNGNQQTVSGNEQPANTLPVVPENEVNKSLPGNMQQQAIPTTSATELELLPKEQNDQKAAPIGMPAMEANTQEPVGTEIKNNVTNETTVLPTTTGTTVTDVTATQKVAAQPAATNTTTTVTVDKVGPEVAASEFMKSEEPVVTKISKNKGKNKIAIKSKVKKVAKGAPTFWSVQVGSFSDQPRMQRMVNSLQATGFKVYLQKITTSRGLMVRVLVGRENSKDKAVKVAQQLKTKLKIEGRIVGNKK